MSNVWGIYYCLVKNNLIKQMRSYSFLVVVLLTLLLGYASVPSPSSGYQVFYIGGVRGIYNSAWLGGIVTMMSTLLLWLFAFFMLRSQVSEDQRLKVGQIIASTPVSNFRYIFSKVISNYVVLLVIELILFLAFMGMQLIHGEDDFIHIADYLKPFVFIVMPSLLVLAAWTVLFDVMPGLKGVVGNIIFFALWVFFSIVSIAAPSSLLDVFGLDIIRSDMVREATLKYAFLSMSEEGGSFGYYPVEGTSPTFVWHGVEWSRSLLIYRLAWAGIALLVILVSSLVFNRFRMKENANRNHVLVIYESKKDAAAKPENSHEYKLSPVKREKRVRMTRLIRAEMFIMLKDCSIWWYLLVLGSMAASLLISLENVQSWLPVLALWPIAIWSQMGTREKYYFTRELLMSSCPPLKRFFAGWISGILITLLVFSAALVHFILDGQWAHLTAWLVSVLFVPTLAMFLGTISGTRKMFEVIYILWWYMGAVNDLPYLNFLGTATNYALLYGILTCVLLIVALVWQQIKAGALGVGVTNRKIKMMTMVFAAVMVLFLSGCDSKPSANSAGKIFDGKQVEEIVIKTDGQNIEIRPASSAEIKVSTKGGKEISAELNDGVLDVNYGSSSALVNFKTDTLQIELPDKQFAKISLTTFAGQIKGEGLKADELMFTGDSGSLEINGFEGKRIQGKIAAGDIELTGIAGDFIIENDAGNVKVSHNGQLAHESSIRTETGNVEMTFENAPNALEIDASTESGKIESSLTSASDVNATGAGQELKATIGTSAGAPNLTIKSSAGSIYIK
ncbi:hypothetical protein YSY43_06900 [Paenibacillus sp. YSY-4.3]